jgi:hypothetical protein
MRTLPSPDQDEPRVLCVLDEDPHTDTDVGCCRGAGRGGDGLCGGWNWRAV